VNLLLDTCSFLWALHEPDRLSPTARAGLQTRAHTVQVSVINFWEIGLKAGLGKLSLDGVSPEDYPRLAEKSGWIIVPLSAKVASSVGRLKPSSGHRDPFDRLLIWTAIHENYALVSGDEAIRSYGPQGLKVCW
jgi:PIN domain nuclease of toxin-antitoxin system